MAVSVVQDAQLSRRVESRHIDHIPAGARHGQPGTARRDRQLTATALFARPRPGAMVRPATRSSA
jgi:hypothetical protein